MPPFVRTQCPRCQHVFPVDLAQLQRTSVPVYREGKKDDEAPHEYRVTCPKCGHPFKFPWPPPASQE